MTLKLKEILEYDDRIVELFLESPLRYKRWDLNILDMPSKNYLFTIGVKEKAKFIEHFGEYKIFRYTAGDFSIDCFVTETNTVSFFQYKNDNITCNIHKVWQDPITIGLNRKIILEYYLKIYDGVLTDNIHTELGEKSIRKLLNSAMDLGYKVFVVKNETEKTYIEDLDGIDQYYSYGADGLQYKFGIEK